MKSYPLPCLLFLLTVTFGFQSCSLANRNAALQPIQAESQPNESKKGNPEFRIFLAGDAGAAGNFPLDPTLALLKAEAEAAGENAAVLFLGDNAYPAGLPPEGHKNRNAAELSLGAQLEAVRNFRGKTIFIPGNHDWNESRKGGWDYVRNEEVFIESRLGDSLAFQPGGGCPGPFLTELHPGIVFITLDTEWWLSQHEKPEGETSPCACKSKQEVLDSLSSMLKRNAEKTIVLATHHPLFSNGPHGGYNGIKTHVFPLTVFSENLYIPLPVFGSIFVLLRKIFPPRQDLSHREYRNLRERILPLIDMDQRLIMVSGHEHNLQTFIGDSGQNHFLISGSASKSSPVSRKKSRRSGLSPTFCYPGKGYLELRFYRNAEKVFLEAKIPQQAGKGKFQFIQQLMD